jgi:hypothetical protein
MGGDVFLTLEREVSADSPMGSRTPWAACPPLSFRGIFGGADVRTVYRDHWSRLYRPAPTAEG